MQFALDDEQRALQDAVRSYLRDRFGPDQVREVYEHPETDGVPEKLWRSIGEQGWLAVLVPEEHDGIGLGLLDASVIARAFGAGTVPGPWLGTLLLGEAVRLAGSDAQKQAILPRVAAGEIIGAAALLKSGAYPSPEGAPASASGTSLTGRLEFVEYAASADTLVVATTDGLHLVDPKASGVTLTAHETLDRTTRLVTVQLDGVEGEKLEGSTPEVVQELLDRAAVLVASDLVGIARKALMDTVEYDKTRVQFGKPVGSFQAIKHDLADLLLSVTMAEHAVLYAAFAVDSGAPDTTAAVSIAKAKAGDTASWAVGAMIQYHGGIGYTWEHDSHFYLKRAKRLQYQYGDAIQHRERIARLLVDTAQSGELTAVTPGGTEGVAGAGVAAASA